MTDNRTTELREGLTERGVKWWPMRNNGYYEDRDTEFVVNGKKHTAHEWGDGLAVYNLTPEQAIAATLGSGNADTDDVLTLLDGIREADRISYDDYTRLFDAIAELGSELNQDGLPVGLTISNDGNLLNWRGENYVRQAIAATLNAPINEVTGKPFDFNKLADRLDGDKDVDWDKVERVEIEGDVYVKERTCELHYGEDDDGYDGWYCDECSGWFQAVRRDGHLVKPKHCQECGAKVVGL